MRQSSSRTISALILALLTILGTLIFLAAGCGTEEQAADDSAGTGTTETVSQKTLTPELLQEMAARRIGDARLVRTAVMTGEGDNKVVLFEVIRPEVCHDGAVVGTVATFSQKTMSALFKYPEVSRVDVILYGTTEDPSSNNEVAVKITVDRNNAEKIDWFALNDTNLASLVTSFFIDPRVQANWQVEGGGSTPNSQKTETTATTATQ